MIKLGRTCLLLDVDGVLFDHTWRRGLHQFTAWAWQTFDLVCLLTARRGETYKLWPGSQEGCGPCPISLSWDEEKTEPLPGLLRAGYRLFWAEDGILDSEAAWCKKQGVAHYVDCTGTTDLLEVKRRILWAMAEARKGGS